MSDKTLYLVQANANQTAQALDKIIPVLAAEDQIVLMGDSVHAVFLAQTQHIQQPIWALATDLELLPSQIFSEDSNKVHSLSYSELTDLILNFKRCISIK